MKEQQFLGCGFLLMVALLVGCATQAPSGAGNMNTGQSAERIGGQAGQGDELEKVEGAVGQPGERVGGQAGEEVHHKQKVEGAAGQPGERIGGQAGEGDELKKVEGAAGQ